MAAPIIQPLVFNPAIGTPGQPTRVTVLATDPDTKILQVTVRVTDESGLFSERTDPHSVQGTLDYGPMTTDDPAATVTQDLAVPNEFTLVPGS